MIKSIRSRLFLLPAQENDHQYLEKRRNEKPGVITDKARCQIMTFKSWKTCQAIVSHQNPEVYAKAIYDQKKESIDSGKSDQKPRI